MIGYSLAMTTALSARRLDTIGFVGVVTGVVGILSAALMLAWPAEVSPDVLSYPFTVDGFRTIQTWFFVHHIGLDVLAVGFALSAGLGTSRVASVGAWLAVLGLLGLTGMELFAIQFAEWNAVAANQGTMGAGYGMTTSLVGLGMLIAGVGVLRARVWTGWWRFVPLLIGVTHFVVVTPAIFSNGYVVARLAIAMWMALFGALGWCLVREARRRD